MIETPDKCIKCGSSGLDTDIRIERYGSARLLLKVLTYCVECAFEEEYTAKLDKGI